MQVLLKVVELGSFTAAAESLDLPKSSVSRRVTQLEERLGIRLLQRTTRSVRLTTAGEVYFETASRLLSELDELERQVAGFRDQPRGLLRLTCPSGFAASNAGLFAQFALRYPEVRLQVEESDRFVDLVGEGFDLAFRGGRGPDPSLSGLRLISSERILVCSTAYRSRKGMPGRIKDLVHHDLATLAPRHKDTWQLLAGRRELQLEVVSSFVTNNLRMLQQATESGMGIALLPRCNCDPGLASGSLLQVLPQWTASPATLWLVYPSARGMASSVRAFVDEVRSWPQLRL